MSNAVEFTIIAVSVVICAVFIMTGIVLLNQSSSLFNSGSQELNKDISFEENLIKQYDNKIFTGNQVKDLAKELQEQGIATLLYYGSGKQTYFLDGMTDKSNDTYLDDAASVQCRAEKGENGTLLGFVFTVGTKDAMGWVYPNSGWEFNLKEAKESNTLVTSKIGNTQYQIFETVRKEVEKAKELSRLSSRQRQLKSQYDNALVKSIDYQEDSEATVNKNIEAIYKKKANEYTKFASFYSMYSQYLREWIDKGYYGILLYNKSLFNGTDAETEIIDEGTDTSVKIGDEEGEDEGFKSDTTASDASSGENSADLGGFDVDVSGQNGSDGE